MSFSIPTPFRESIEHQISEIERIALGIGNSPPGAAQCRLLISRLTRLGHSILTDWPVPVAEEQLIVFRNILVKVNAVMQTFIRNPAGTLEFESFAIQLDQQVTHFEDAKMRAFIAGATPSNFNSAADEIRSKLEVLNAEIEKVQSVARATATKQTIKNEQAFFANQAIKFVRIAYAGLTVFILLSIWLLWVLSTFHSSGDIVKDYLAQDVSIRAQMAQFQSACPDCMRTLFLNALFKANAVRLVQVSFLLFLIAVALKSFNSGIHNYTINMHRSNALHAALRLFDKPVTDAGKDALIDKAASAIFVHQPTGFNSKTPSNLVQNIMELGKKQKDE